MLNKWSIATCALVALGLMSFTSVSSNTEMKFVNNKTVQNGTPITWAQLGQIEFIKKRDNVYGAVMCTVIHPTLKNLQGKTIVAKGFIVPIDNKSYALSKNVLAQCFFCGNAGSETSMGIHLKGNTPQLKTETYVTIEGTFRYN